MQEGGGHSSHRAGVMGIQRLLSSLCDPKAQSANAAPSTHPTSNAEAGEQWLQRHPEAGSSMPSWPRASQAGVCDHHIATFSKGCDIPILNPEPSTHNSQPSTLNPQPTILNPQPSTLNPQFSTLNPQPST